MTLLYLYCIVFFFFFSPNDFLGFLVASSNTKTQKCIKENSEVLFQSLALNPIFFVLNFGL